MIQISDLSKQYGPQILFEHVSLQLNPGQRYGLVGANGSGKTTFLKMLMGEEGSDRGEISFKSGLKLGVLRQDQFLQDSEKIVHVAMRGDAEVFEALKALDSEAPAADSSGTHSHNIAEYTDLLTQRDGYTLEARAREILEGLGLPTFQLDEPLSVLSGGFKLRVLLAQVLVGAPDVLLLDEPTNHLDILSIRWLENFLGGYTGCAVVISHDRHFLDRVATRILDVDYLTISDYPGNFTQFRQAKELRSLQNQAQAARVEKEIAAKKAFVERFRAKATKARQAQSRVKQLEKIEVVEVARTTRRAPHFLFPMHRTSGREALQVDALKKSYGSARVLTDVEFQVRRGEKIAVIGPNGIGKSTLLKILAGDLSADGGKFEWGVNTQVGYFAQDHRQLLKDPKLTPLEYVWGAVPDETVSYVRGQLGRHLFSGDDVNRPVSALSGGEAARLVFARLAVEKPNVLLLDEPTNHLDLEAIEALAEALKNYEGTLIFVSHDRWFVSEIASRILELKPNGLSDFSGTYEEYLEKLGDDHLSADAISLRAKEERRRDAAQLESGTLATETSYEERKRRANRLKSLPKKRDEVLARIEALETEKAALDSRYADQDYFTQTPDAEQRLDQEKRKALERDLEALVSAWEELETELEQLQVDAG